MISTENILDVCISKKDVDGIILILSCQKHKNTRLKEFSLSKTNYNNWEVIYVIGDLFLKENYILDGNMLYIKCEDSYLHLLKKLALAIKSVKCLFNIKEGILRCGDDLIFNENNLTMFTKYEKFDYWGQSYFFRNYKCIDKNTLKNIRTDTFMIDYYINHQEDFLNSQHGMTNMNMSSLFKYVTRPDLFGAAGVIFYLSNKACDIVINHMEKINFDVLSYDIFTQSYPYIMEDCGISFIMYYNDIEFTDGQFFFDTEQENTIAKHTNKFK
jgi:hypothetical protein